MLQSYRSTRRPIRSDEEIARDISLAIGSELTARGVECRVWEGFATLNGTVEWHSQRDNMEACARKVPGVRGVMNNIAIRSRAATC